MKRQITSYFWMESQEFLHRANDMQLAPEALLAVLVDRFLRERPRTAHLSRRGRRKVKAQFRLKANRKGVAA